MSELKKQFEYKRHEAAEEASQFQDKIAYLNQMKSDNSYMFDNEKEDLERELKARTNVLQSTEIEYVDFLTLYYIY